MIQRQFRQRFTLLKDTPAQNSTGRKKRSPWEVFGTYQGLIDLLSGTRGEVAGKVVDTSTHMLFCLAETPIQAGDRVKADGEMYKVNHVDNPMRRGRFLQVELEVLPDGISKSDS